MKTLIPVIVLVLWSSASAVSAQPEPQCEPGGCHDCNGYTEGDNHLAETFQGVSWPDSCIATTISDASIDCVHQYGPNVWVALNLDGSLDSSCNGYQYIACGSLQCRSGNGWYTHGFTVKGIDCAQSDAKLHASSSGIACFRDNNGDDRYTPGSDYLYNFWGCTQ